MPLPRRHLEVLTALCNLPTAPYCEQHIIDWLLTWAKAQGKSIQTRRDSAGNVYLEYRRGRTGRPPLVIEAHMDHPGFIVTRQKKGGIIDAEFRGSVKPSHFTGGRVQFWLNDPIAVGTVAPVAATGRWIKARVTA